MSALLTSAVRARQKAQSSLSLVRPVQARTSRTPFAVVVMALLAAGLTGLILLSTVLQSQSFELNRLHEKSDALTTRHDALASHVHEKQNPSAIADAALDLGMVPAANPVFLDLARGSVIGSPTPAESGTELGGDS